MRRILVFKSQVPCWRKVQSTRCKCDQMHALKNAIKETGYNIFLVLSDFLLVSDWNVELLQTREVRLVQTSIAPCPISSVCYTNRQQSSQPVFWGDVSLFNMQPLSETSRVSSLSWFQIHRSPTAKRQGQGRKSGNMLSLKHRRIGAASCWTT